MRTGAPVFKPQLCRVLPGNGVKKPLGFLPAPSDVGDVEMVRKIPPRQLWSPFWEELRQRASKSSLTEPNCQASLAGTLQTNCWKINTEKAKH